MFTTPIPRYNEALHLYNADDIRTWRTICPRSEVQYSEVSPALALATPVFFAIFIFFFLFSCFHSRGQPLCKFIGTKESVYIRKRVQLPQDWFGTQTWLPFHCFGTHYMAAMTSCQGHPMAIFGKISVQKTI